MGVAVILSRIINAVVRDLQKYDKSCQTTILEPIYDNNMDSVTQNSTWRTSTK